MRVAFDRSEKVLLFTLAFIQFSHIVDFVIMMPLGPQLMRIFSINPSQFGLLVSAYTFAAGVSGLLSAFLVDRFDRKSTLLFFYVGFCLSTLACALSPTYEVLMFARLATGCFGGVLGSTVFAIVGDAIHPSRRGTALGIVMVSFSVASIFGVPFSLYLANYFGWHAPFLFLALISFLLVFVIIKLIPSMTGHMQGLRESALQLIIRVSTSRNQMLALAFLVLLVFGQFSIIPFLSPSFVSNAGLSESQLPLVYFLGGLASIFSSPLIGRFSDTLGKRKIFVGSAILSLVPIYLITRLEVTPIALVLLLSTSFFICMGGRIIPAMAMITSTVKPDYRGSFMSIMSSAQNLAAAGAAFVAGQIVEKNTSGQILHYSTVGVIAVIFSCLAMLTSLVLSPAEGEGKF